MTQEELLTDLRHRLRTPLNHIIGYSELLLEDAAGSDPDSAAHLRSIRANAHLILSQIQHRLSPDKEGAAAEKIAGLRADITEPLDVIVATAGRLSSVCGEVNCWICCASTLPAWTFSGSPRATISLAAYSLLTDRQRSGR